MKPDTTDLLIEDLPAARAHLRVAVVTETYPPEINGVALTLQRVVEGLRQRDHDVQLIRPRQGADRPPAADLRRGSAASAGTAAEGSGEVLLKGLPIPRYPHLQIGLPSRRQLESLWTLQRPDVVHIATEGPLGWSALRVARKLRIPVTTDFRTNFHAYSSHYGMGWLSKPIMAYLRRFHNQTATTMVPTRSLADRLRDAGFERLQVVARGVDTQLFQPTLRDEALRAQWGAKPDTPVWLCVGRLAKEKNLSLLLRAYAQVRLVRPEVKLVLVGDGPARSDLQALAPDAIFTGALDRPTLARHYASADIFGFPSQTETFGNVVLEAMASELAVVAFNYAAAAENIETLRNGILVDMDDDEGFVQQLLRLTQEAPLRAQLRREALLTAQRCDWSGIVTQVESVLMHAIADHRPRLPGRQGLRSQPA